MHQQSHNSNFYVTFCQPTFGLPHPHPGINSITPTIIETTSQYSSSVTPTTATTTANAATTATAVISTTTSNGYSLKLSSLCPQIQLTNRPGQSLVNPSCREW
ncbi:unnamed protein product [Schistocephalus solidus]|uniref:Uncharacterized protein n=1 Tax=Schistocephalus solidus TaxID=70667 RepID=A0A183SNF0_SCHSO|nr:unnamed protein product [Schistocephalus solidus]